jgi:hypothetical protein
MTTRARITVSRADFHRIFSVGLDLPVSKVFWSKPTRDSKSAESPYRSRNPPDTKQPFDLPWAKDCRGKVRYGDEEFRSSPAGSAAIPKLRFGRLTRRLLPPSIPLEPLAPPPDIFLQKDTVERRPIPRRPIPRRERMAPAYLNLGCAGVAPRFLTGSTVSALVVSNRAQKQRMPFWRKSRTSEVGSIRQSRLIKPRSSRKPSISYATGACEELSCQLWHLLTLQAA